MLWVNLVGRVGPLYFEPNFLSQLQIGVFGLHAYDVSLFGGLESPFHMDAMEFGRGVEDACPHQWDRVWVDALARVFPNPHRVLSARGVCYDAFGWVVQFGIDWGFVHWRQAALKAEIGGAQRGALGRRGRVICVAHWALVASRFLWYKG